MQNLIDNLEIPLGKANVVELGRNCADDAFAIQQIIDCSFHDDQQIGFRAAWVLEQVYSNHEASFLPHVETFLKRSSLQTNQSALRIFVKILAGLTGKKVSPEIKGVILSYKTDDLVDAVFGWLIDEKIPVAIKSHCLNILANLIDKHQWIKEELIQTMDFLVEKESIAFFAKVKQIRKQLK